MYFAKRSRNETAESKLLKCQVCSFNIFEVQWSANLTWTYWWCILSIFQQCVEIFGWYLLNI